MTFLSKSIAVNLILLAYLIFASGCNTYDNDYIPFAIKGLDVWVYDNAEDKNFYGGRVKANYFSVDSALSNCQSFAYSVAKQHNLNDWSYVCCTVTPWSDCVTKVR